MGRKAVMPIDGKLRCTRCDTWKQVDDFSPNPIRACGRACVCRICQAGEAKQKYWIAPDNGAQRVAKWREENPERYRESLERNRLKAAERIQEYRRIKNTEYLARKTLQDAIRKGVLVRGCCEVCGNPNTDGHHWSYEKEHWLNVKWLCRKHHLELHARERREKKLTEIKKGERDE